MTLKEVRTARGLSQSQLAQLSGVSLRMIQKYEIAEKDINGAKIKTLLLLANTLQCSLSDILTNPEVIELLEKYDKKRAYPQLRE